MTSAAADTLPAAILDRRAVFVGGKGGVGKTTLAAALGFASVGLGRRVLLVSTDPAHSLGDLLETRLDDRPQGVSAGLSALELDPARAVSRYVDRVGRHLREYVKPALYGEIERQLAQAREAPGAVEAAVLEQLAGWLDAPPADCDLMIFDTAPTGQTLRLLSLPETMSAWTGGLLARQRENRAIGGLVRGWLAGTRETAAEQRRARLAAALERRRRLFAHARERLTDPDCTAFVMVLTPERLPIEETGRALDMLESARITVAALVVNRVLPKEADGDFLAARRTTEVVYLDEIKRRFAGRPRVEVPLLATDVRREDGLEELIRILEATPLIGG